MGSVMVGVVIALAVGLTVGRVHERAKRARSDYAKTRSLVAGMRKTAWTTTFESIRAGFLIGLGLVVVFVAMFHFGANP